MAFIFTKAWDAAIAKNVRDFYDTLSEKEQRRFAAVQARQLGYGGVKYIAKILGCSRRTIERGLAELDKLPNDPAAGQVRRPGAGRKKTFCPIPRWTTSRRPVRDGARRWTRRRRRWCTRTGLRPSWRSRCRR